MYRFFLILIFLFFGSFLFSQNLDNVKRHIQKLSSPEFHGRGYVYNASEISAEYLANEFKSAGVLAFNNSYFQDFYYDVNTFPGIVAVSIDGKKMVPGVDFLVGPMTPTTKSSFELFVPDSLLLNDTVKFFNRYISEDWKSKMLVIDYAQTNNREIKMFYIKLMLTNSRFGGIAELINEELMASVGRRQQTFPEIKIKRECFDKAAKTISINVKAKFETGFEAKNVVGYIEGKNPDKYFVFTAHYDHIGQMGKKILIPGAQDNASGVATVLDLAEYYSKNKPEYSVAFILFFGEEAGLLGSQFYVNNPMFPLSKIKMLVNLDMVGTGDDGITIVNSADEEYKDVWETFEIINKENSYFETIKQRGISANSDHHSFNEKGVKAVFIYTMGAKTYYHNPKDTFETLTFSGYKSLFGLLTKFVERYE